MATRLRSGDAGQASRAASAGSWSASQEVKDATSARTSVPLASGRSRWSGLMMMALWERASSRNLWDETASGKNVRVDG